ncbi:MAG: hypothetical protein AAFU60_04260, partial [Bacteroidota bacterium]
MKNAFGWGVVGLCLITSALACNAPSSGTVSPSEAATPNVAATQTPPIEKDLGLFGLVSMEGSTHTLILDDFLPSSSELDSITGPEGLDLVLSADKATAELTVIGDIP